MKSIINNSKIIEVTENDLSEITLNKEGNQVILRLKGQNINAKILKEDHLHKEYEIEINKKIYHVRLESKLEADIHSIKMMEKPKSLTNEVKSPMPGLVLKISVNEGDIVHQGQTLLILEAMKMENLIKSPVEGTIKKINIGVGEAVEKGHSLISFEL
ncbi:MAG TPA: acetyl-CoA carboxylase biotin carboxyl carrier protein subunit [Saprospiraceae bacterium]|nr:acetyl-CoA carboxylase biotin carboxyl carrier protein subunit [Saprospiraceae bacterium]HQW55038.1 acetyl-CoA carboxylase biotin carboxyl carrier protein subunit [Saprospiraceae bacterium]